MLSFITACSHHLRLILYPYAIFFVEPQIRRRLIHRNLLLNANNKNV